MATNTSALFGIYRWGWGFWAAPAHFPVLGGRATSPEKQLAPEPAQLTVAVPPSPRAGEQGRSFIQQPERYLYTAVIAARVREHDTKQRLKQAAAGLLCQPVSHLCRNVRGAGLVGALERRRKMRAVACRNRCDMRPPTAE
jgi:hypothetical protein